MKRPIVRQYRAQVKSLKQLYRPFKIDGDTLNRLAVSPNQPVQGGY